MGLLVNGARPQASDLPIAFPATDGQNRNLRGLEHRVGHIAQHRRRESRAPMGGHYDQVRLIRQG